MFANMALPSVEVTESEQPISVLAYGFMPDRAGAGKYRGGVPFYRDYRLEADEATLSVRADRHTVQPFGLYGGSPGAPSENWSNPGDDDKAELLISKPTMMFRKGDVFRHIHAGGGGWGDPLERDPAAVLADVRNEFLSAEKAAADYGVVIDTATWQIDAVATAARRDEIRRKRNWSEAPAVSRGLSPSNKAAAE
jgi:N-methylhydantoinase B